MMKILFAGDFSVQGRAVSLFRDMNKAIEAFESVKKVCESHDLSIVNFESPVTEGKNKILKDGPCIQNPKISVEVLKNVGFALFTLANNHLKDYGARGVTDTIKECQAQNVAYVGAGACLDEARKPYIYEKGEKKVGILNVCENESSIASDYAPGANPISEINLYYDVNSIVSLVDYVIVIVHGGREHYKLPTPRMKKFYRYIIDLGADLVVSHHQHCYGGYEIYKGKPIFYGLGNFYFDRYGKRNAEWNKGLLLSVDFNDTLSFDLLPITQCNDKPEVLIEDYKFVAKEIKEINRIIQDDNLLEESYFQLVNRTKPLSPMQPYTTHYVRALYNRGFLPDAISKVKKVMILNVIRCETHRELLIAYLERCLKE